MNKIFLSRENTSRLYKDILKDNNLQALPRKSKEIIVDSLVSNMKDMKDFVIKYKCGSVININCKEALKNDIENFFKKRQDFILSKENKNHLIEKFSWEAQENKLLDIYYSTLVN